MPRFSYKQILVASIYIYTYIYAYWYIYLTLELRRHRAEAAALSVNVEGSHRVMHYSLQINTAAVRHVQLSIPPASNTPILSHQMLILLL